MAKLSFLRDAGFLASFTFDPFNKAGFDRLQPIDRILDNFKKDFPMNQPIYQATFELTRKFLSYVAILDDRTRGMFAESDDHAIRHTQWMDVLRILFPQYVLEAMPPHPDDKTDIEEVDVVQCQTFPTQENRTRQPATILPLQQQSPAVIEEHPVDLKANQTYLPAVRLPQDEMPVDPHLALRVLEDCLRAVAFQKTVLKTREYRLLAEITEVRAALGIADEWLFPPHDRNYLYPENQLPLLFDTNQEVLNLVRMEKSRINTHNLVMTESQAKLNEATARIVELERQLEIKEAAVQGLTITITQLNNNNHFVIEAQTKIKDLEQRLDDKISRLEMMETEKKLAVELSIYQSNKLEALQTELATKVHDSRRQIELNKQSDKIISEGEMDETDSEEEMDPKLPNDVERNENVIENDDEDDVRNMDTTVVPRRPAPSTSYPSSLVSSKKPKMAPVRLHKANAKVKKYKCPESDCEKTFSSYKKCHIHISLHGEKELYCPCKRYSASVRYGYSMKQHCYQCKEGKVWYADILTKYGRGKRGIDWQKYVQDQKDDEVTLELKRRKYYKFH